MPRISSRRTPAAFLFLLAAFVPAAFADGPYVIGSANTVTADPTIPRPSTTPCIVQLLSNAEFDSFNPVSFTYTPPADCPGPWAKVVFTADINVTAGVQYDRTANFWLGPTIIYFGTTAEPGSTLAPSWHVESDLTDYSPIFLTTQQGTADIGNLVNTTYTGIIYASSTLEFYPLAPGQTAPVTANEVLPLSAGPTGGTVALNSSTDTLSGTFTFPTNIQNVYLDVFSQSQSDDEFWYTCVPNDVASKLESCTNTGFRETEITIDGAPAGVAPVYPWIFTGGIDPFLWFPIPGIQTLNMVPYRVDLTPFAAQLNDGQQHTVSLSVFNADNYFSATASLLLYLDSGSTTVTGALTENTLTVAPTPVVTENLNLSSTISGTVGVASNRNFTIAGYVNTSHGKVTTTISQQINFVNSQKFVINSLEYVQDINQISDVNSTTTVATTGQPTVTTTNNFQFPLTLNIDEVVESNGDIDVTTTASQNYANKNTTAQNGALTYVSALTNEGHHQDTLVYDSSGNFLNNTGQSASQAYQNTDTTGLNVHCKLTAAANALTYFSPTCSQ
ncbi:MAG: peptide-N4-asparagine amidase [Candidatus Sulfotelmatobacter sp.]